MIQLLEVIARMNVFCVRDSLEQAGDIGIILFFRLVGKMQVAHMSHTLPAEGINQVLLSYLFHFSDSFMLIIFDTFMIKQLPDPVNVFVNPVYPTPI